MLEAVLFYTLSAVLLAMGLVVITRTNPIASALGLVAAFAALAALYALLSASLVAVIQVLVYAGGIMVLMIFVIMLLNLHLDDLKPLRPRARTMVWALLGVFAGIFVPVLFVLFSGGPAAAFPSAPLAGDITSVGNFLFSNYMFPFEMLSLVLLTAIVGALVLSKRKL